MVNKWGSIAAALDPSTVAGWERLKPQDSTPPFGGLSVQEDVASQSRRGGLVCLE